ncbi:MAG: GNAT family N-acetyltransferase [Opitutales bacterium]|nr:GNAT family N-acetyltransferase [Opitutales bacterium]
MAEIAWKRPDWARLLKPGHRIFLGSGAAVPIRLVESMLKVVPDVSDLEMVQGLSLGPAPWTEAKYHSHLKVNAFYLDSQLSSLVNAGVDEYTPIHYSEIPALFEQQVLGIDVALIMISPPDAHGYCSLGTTVEWIPAAIKAAHLTIAQINPNVPRSNGLSFIHSSEIDYAIEAESPLPTLKALELDPVYTRIGEFAAQLINDGDTLQLGVGPVGQGLAASLQNHRHLGIHSEVIGDGVMRLFEQGVVDNSKKELLPGKIVAAQALGSEDFYRFLDGNPHVDFRPTEFVNNPATIARNRRMVSVNGALMVDLTGQVVVDSLPGDFRQGVGSIVDFVRGAGMSPGGRPIIALPSTGSDKNGKTFSRIVTQLPAGAGVGCNRADVYYIVTEHGIATLRGRTIQERVKELIQVADPNFREALLKEAREQNLVPGYFSLPPAQPESTAGVAARKIRLRDNRDYILRPLNPADDRRLQEFFYSHTEETIVRRYGFTVTRMSRERAFELVCVDQSKDLALGIFELQGPRQVIRAVGRYYLDADGKAGEMAFVVGENRRRVGMARTLVEAMIQVAQSRGLAKLWAQVDRDNLPMLKLFRSLEAEEETGDDYHTVHVTIPIQSPKDDQEGGGSGLRSFLNLRRR